MITMLTEAWEIWIAAGLVLMALEAMVPGAFLVWLGLASLGTGAIAVWFSVDFGGQVASCAILSAVSVMIGLRVRKARGPGRVNMPHSGLVGRQVEVLTFEGERGRVRLGDSDWPARLSRGMAIPGKGTLLRVTGVDGVVLVLGHAAD